MKVGELNIGRIPNYDPYHLLMGSMGYMVEQARYAAENDSYSYRNFKVGVAIFAASGSTRSTAVFSAGNVKAKQHTKAVCAELRGLTQVKKAKFEKVLGLVVAGTTDVQEIVEVNHAAAPTLHPCVRCRELFDVNPLMADDTLVVSVGLDSDKYQVHTKREIVDLYDGGFPPEDAGTNELAVLERGVTTYDYLAMAEQSLPLAGRRSPAFLAMMALKGTQ